MTLRQFPLVRGLSFRASSGLPVTLSPSRFQVSACSFGVFSLMRVEIVEIAIDANVQ
jgi:hypothetical protein